MTETEAALRAMHHALLNLDAAEERLRRTRHPSVMHGSMKAVSSQTNTVIMALLPLIRRDRLAHQAANGGDMDAHEANSAIEMAGWRGRCGSTA